MTIIETHENYIELISTHPLISDSINKNTTHSRNAMIHVYPFKKMFLVVDGYKRDFDLMRHLTPFSGSINLEKVMAFSKIIRNRLKKYGRLDKYKEFLSYFFVGDEKTVYKIGFNGEVLEINHPYASKNKPTYYAYKDLHPKDDFVNISHNFLKLVEIIKDESFHEYSYLSTQDFQIHAARLDV